VGGRRQGGKGVCTASKVLAEIFVTRNGASLKQPRIIRRRGGHDSFKAKQKASKAACIPGVRNHSASLECRLLDPPTDA